MVLEDGGLTEKRRYLLCFTQTGYLCTGEKDGEVTLRLGVKGSGSLMLRGKALRMRFRIWMQLVGMTSQKLKW